MALSATAGQLLINDALPPDLRDYSRVLDKKGLNSLFREVAQKHPDKYRDISFRLMTIGKLASQDSGGMSISLNHLQKSPAAKRQRQRLQQKLHQLLSSGKFSGEELEQRIVEITKENLDADQKEIYDEAAQAKNPLTAMIGSGAKGNPGNLVSLLGSDRLYADPQSRVIPVPVLRSYSEGLSPSEYWAGAYGTRQGVLATKLSVASSGFVLKQMAQAMHRLISAAEDYEDPEQQKILRGMPVDTADPDSEGALLAKDIGPYKKNTVLLPKIRKHLEQLGIKRILIRSPIAGGTPDGALYARDIGVREAGTLPGHGEQVGLQAAQSLGEPLSQATLSAKHSGGIVGTGKSLSGFQAINQLLQVPKTFQYGASHAEVDGLITKIEPAPAGGHHVWIAGKSHYVPADVSLQVKSGDQVEAGDVLSEGMPNPAVLVRHKGIGEGRRYFVNSFMTAMRDAGMSPARRNVELLARGLINHVQLTGEYGDFVPDDIVPYSSLEHTYRARPQAFETSPDKAVGKYLEKPVLHYTLGTKIRPSALPVLKEFGVDTVTVHDEPPPFQPHMVRAMYNLHYDPDPLTQMYGSGLKDSLLTSTHLGRESNEEGSSFVPSLARSTDFGMQGLVRTPGPGTPIDSETGQLKEPSIANSIHVNKIPQPKAPKPAGPPDKPDSLSWLRL